MLKKNNFITHLIITAAIITIALTSFFFILKIEKSAQENCFDVIEEKTKQISEAFTEQINEKQTQLEIFAEILQTNKDNLPLIIDQYMNDFCEGQNFVAICFHRDNEEPIYCGEAHLHASSFNSITEEFNRLPYVSDIVAEEGESSRNKQYVYIAVPVFIQDNATPDGALYGYISLEKLKDFIPSVNDDNYFYLVDEKTGNYLIDEYHRYDENGNELDLGNMFDGRLEKHETKKGYTVEKMRDDIRNEKSGFYLFKSQKNSEWYYTYYMPLTHEVLENNNWSLQLIVEEEHAFAHYHEIRDIVVVLLVIIGVCLIAITATLLLRSYFREKRRKLSLHKSEYLNSIQSALISAHSNPDFVDQALKIVCQEMKAETAMLLVIEDKIVTSAQYWPSSDKLSALAMIGINIRDVFPNVYDVVIAQNSFYYDEIKKSSGISQTAIEMFKQLDIRNTLIVPITAQSGILKGVIATVNMKEEFNAEMLECVTNHFFMAITNLENHNLIKNMSEIDYLTQVKNRNRYERDIAEFAVISAQSLWCAFIDVNGLHDLNNTKGHKAGDIMLTTVASVTKKIFGEYVYRLGGDEFIAFKTDSSHEEFMSLKHRLIADVEKKGYSVSIGFSSANKNENGVFDVDNMVSEAEEYMYREKKEYYQKMGKTGERETPMKKTKR